MFKNDNLLVLVVCSGGRAGGFADQTFEYCKAFYGLIFFPRLPWRSEGSLVVQPWLLSHWGCSFHSSILRWERYFQFGYNWMAERLLCIKNFDEVIHWKPICSANANGNFTKQFLKTIFHTPGCLHRLPDQPGLHYVDRCRPDHLPVLRVLLPHAAAHLHRGLPKGVERHGVGAGGAGGVSDEIMPSRKVWGLSGVLILFYVVWSMIPICT